MTSFLHVFQEDSNESFEKDDSLVCLIDMGYSHGEASAAIARCGVCVVTTSSSQK